MGILKLIIAGLSLVSAQNLRGSNTALSFLEQQKCNCGGNKSRCKCGTARGCCPNCCPNSCAKTGCCGCKCCGCCATGGPKAEIKLDGMYVTNSKLPDFIPSCFRAIDDNLDDFTVINDDVAVGEICHGATGSAFAELLYVKGDPEAAKEE